MGLTPVLKIIQSFGSTWYRHAHKYLEFHTEHRHFNSQLTAVQIGWSFLAKVCSHCGTGDPSNSLGCNLNKNNS